MPNIRDFKILETAYRRLHTASEQVDCAEREIGHLEIAKDELYPGECLGQSTFNKYEHWDEDPRKSDWWKRLARTDLLNSAANIDRKLEGLNASKTEFEAVESALRGYINELSRPYLRKLNIQDLPDELLLEIFELMEADDVSFSFPIYGPDTKDIKNSRLVCRRFCDVSSQLLLRHVQVGFNETSLAHLEEVSRHPTIAKGVRSVEVVLHFYSYSFPDLEGFLSYHADGLEKEVNSLEHAKRSEVWKYWLSRINTTEETVLKVIAEGTAIISTLRRLASADHSDGGYSEDDKGHRERLGAIHQQYLNLLTNQESMIRSGKFSRVVNSAMARMPGARKLELKDSDLALLESRGLVRTNPCCLFPFQTVSGVIVLSRRRFAPE